jgi:hypothetical protein
MLEPEPLQRHVHQGEGGQHTSQQPGRPGSGPAGGQPRAAAWPAAPRGSAWVGAADTAPHHGAQHHGQQAGLEPAASSSRGARPSDAGANQHQQRHAAATAAKWPRSRERATCPSSRAFSILRAVAGRCGLGRIRPWQKGSQGALHGAGAAPGLSGISGGKGVFGAPQPRCVSALSARTKESRPAAGAIPGRSADNEKTRTPGWPAGRRPRPGWPPRRCGLRG